MNERFLKRCYINQKFMKIIARYGEADENRHHTFETAQTAAAYSESFSADPMPRALLVAHTSWRVLS
jgi:hypothetical protein